MSNKGIHKLFDRVVSMFIPPYNIFKKQDGMALVLTMSVVALLTILLFELHYQIRIELELSDNYLSKLKALYDAEAMINYKIALLRLDQTPYDSLDEEWAKALDDVPVPNKSRIECSIADESRKIYVNGATGKDSQVIQSQLGALFDRLQFEKTCLPALYDWIDLDSDVRTGGAEKEYYMSLTPGYHCQNMELYTLSEMLMLKGFERRFLYEPKHPSDDTFFSSKKEEEESKSLRDYLTIYGSNGRIGSDEKININTASEKVLEGLFNVPQFGVCYSNYESCIKQIIEDRKEHPFELVDDLRPILGDLCFNVVSSHLTVGGVGTPGYFSVEAKAYSGDVKVELYVVLKREHGLVCIVYWKEVQD
ncbi:MAG: hypothetical protein V1872_07390 [bacterium]